MNLAGCAEEIQHRIIHIFSRDEAGRRAVNGGNPKFNKDPYFRDYVHFFEVSFMVTTTADPSSSTAMTAAVSEPATRRVGPDSSRGPSTRQESSVVSRRRPRRRDLVS